MRSCIEKIAIIPSVRVSSVGGFMFAAEAASYQTWTALMREGPDRSSINRAFQALIWGSRVMRATESQWDFLTRTKFGAD